LSVLIVVAIAIAIELLVIIALGCWHCHHCRIQQSGLLSVSDPYTNIDKKESENLPRSNFNYKV